MTDLSGVPAQARSVAPTAAILAAWGQVESDYLPRADFLTLAANLLHIARSQVSLAVGVILARMQPQHPVVGPVVKDYQERDQASLQTVTEDTDAAAERIERFVTATLEQYSRDEVLDIASDYGATGWIWRTDAEPCEYCADREGNEYGIEETFRDHPNCDCYPEPIFDGGFSDLAEADAREEDEG